MKAPERLYRTADGDVVGHGDERAAFLLVSEGKEIPEEYEAAAKKFLDGSKPKAKPAEPKQAAPAENKQAKPAPNKKS
jgi:hypothetical protein